MLEPGATHAVRGALIGSPGDRGLPAGAGWVGVGAGTGILRRTGTEDLVGSRIEGATA